MCLSRFSGLKTSYLTQEIAPYNSITLDCHSDRASGHKKVDMFFSPEFLPFFHDSEGHWIV